MTATASTQGNPPAAASYRWLVRRALGFGPPPAPPMAYVRALRGQVDAQWAELLRQLDEVVGAAPHAGAAAAGAAVACVPPESVQRDLLELAFSDPPADAGLFRRKVLLPWLARAALGDGRSLPLRPDWPAALRPDEADLRSLAATGCLDGPQVRQLRTVVAAGPKGVPGKLAAAIDAVSAVAATRAAARASAGTEATSALPLALALLDQAEWATFLRLWAAGCGTPASGRAAAAAAAAAAGGGGPAIEPLPPPPGKPPARRAGVHRWTVLETTELSEELKTWLGRRGDDPALCPLWPRVEIGIFTTERSAVPPPVAESDREAAVFSLLDDPPPAQTRAALLVVAALKSACGNRPTLRWKWVKKLAGVVDLVPRPASRAELVAVVLQGCLADDPLRRCGLEGHLARVLACERAAQPASPAAVTKGLRAR